ncbi:hypothetical protein [Erythrobacter sp. YT30]|uniref:hypothetical protein n=1 Tax=Erythrobacter sp. YT30 TaxID=1735012 RepID=UPI00076CC49A|nr:hypothetical protein [Erythrobacter sp. YT30]KWV91736.1 hypothetical protein AUC45_11060 [Erythrobacter sp. YT30]
MPEKITPDLLIERKVDHAIEGGERVPRWGWPTPRSYNGATGEERIAGWKKVAVARNLDLLPRSVKCEVCRVRDANGSHTEIYHRCMTTKPICRSCHFKVHKRFQKPERWLAFIETMPAADWVYALLTRELSRAEMLKVARAPDVFAALQMMKL